VCVMVTKRKNPHAVALGRKGGQAKSPAKTAAARRNVRTRWERLAKQVAGIPDKQRRRVAKRVLNLIAKTEKLEERLGGPFRLVP